MSDVPVRPLPCQRCGLDPRELRDGYLTAEEVEALFEEVPPEVLRHLIRAIREHKEQGRTGGAGITFDGTRGEVQKWNMLGSLNLSVDARKARRAG